MSKKIKKELAIHERWKITLEERGVKQRWLAKQTGISYPHISNILAGRVFITMANKNRINEALGTFYY